ncbi:MAG: glycoside hydrolase family 57 protein [Bacteroidales bacterium]|nr:glycoside hydrolase family 57 protein [Bacteroidales bacterium]
MRTICLYFQIHQPFRLKRYRFFNIGNDHYYYDDYLNESIISRVAERSYLQANMVIGQIIKEFGTQFKVAFSISGIALDQMELYTPEVIESFQKLAKTGSVEFLAETYSHSLASLKNKDEFVRQVEEHRQKIRKLFNQDPKVFRNTELIYSDRIGADVAEMGFSAMLSEGPKHVLGWKSPNYMYCNSVTPRLKVLLRNFRISDDISFRFSNKGWSEFPLTAEKFAGWLKKLDKKEETVNLFIDYETFGEHQWMESGIFEFLKALPGVVYKNTNFSFSTPVEIAEKLLPISTISVPYPISWADEERDLTAWLGNELQVDAFNRLYSLTDKVRRCDDEKIQKDWKYLQASDHFYFMSTKFFTAGAAQAYFNPYETPYDAYINYMNVLSDFTIRVNSMVPEIINQQEAAGLAQVIAEKDELIRKYEVELKRLKSSKSKIVTIAGEKVSATKKPVKAPAKKPQKSTTPKKVKSVTKIKGTSGKPRAVPSKPRAGVTKSKTVSAKQKAESSTATKVKSKTRASKSGKK